MTVLNGVVLFVVVIIAIIGLICVDNKINYDEILIKKWTKENGEFYFAVTYYIWQLNKKKRAKEIYTQNTILDFEGYKYIITNFGGEFQVTKDGLFFERELRYWGSPLNKIQSDRNTYLTINQYGSGIINIEVNNNEFINEIVNIQEYISNDTYIDEIDKEVMHSFLNKMLTGQAMNKGEVNMAYDTFLKYEPLLSFSLSIVSLFKDLLIK